MTLNDFLVKEGTLITLKKGEFVFHQGDQDQHIYYVKSGILKAFYTSTDGAELVKSFLQTGDVIGSIRAAYSNESCSFSLSCFDNCQLLKVPFSRLKTYSESDQQLANSVIELLIQFAMKKEKREYEFLCLTAEQRYRALIEQSPELIKRVTQNDLAKYLGVTAVGLSRIKKRVMANI